MPSRASNSPSRAAVSRAVGLAPKREPQKTQREEGTDSDKKASLFVGDPSFRTGTPWYHLVMGRRDANSLFVAPLGVACHERFWRWLL